MGDADGDGWMDLLAPVRSELLAGDNRVLYVGWLLRVLREDAGDDDVEPFRPAGLKTLSPALKKLVDFLAIDEDLLTAAAAGATDVQPVTRDFDAWLLALPPVEKDALLLSLLKADDPHLLPKLRRRFEAVDAPASSGLPARTVADLRAAAESARVEREQVEEQKAAAKRRKKFAALAAREPEAWREVEQLVASKKPANYEAAIVLLCDLRELATDLGDRTPFDARVAALAKRHKTRGSFIEKLRSRKLI